MTDNAVDHYLRDLEHPCKPAILNLRAAVLAADPGISETVKWNAPNFRFGGEDRVTMRLAPRGAFQLVLHRGGKVRSDAEEFAFEDPTGLVRWAAPDRGVIDLAGDGVLDDHLEHVIALVLRWVRA
ncbi:MAG: DUF1801 domain-containing protein [Quadrisphaera sp.]